MTAFLSSGASFSGSNASPSSRESFSTIVLMPACASSSEPKNRRHMERVSASLALSSASPGCTISTSRTLGRLRRSAMSSASRSSAVGPVVTDASLDMKS